MEQTARVAELARLAMSEAELAGMAEQLSAIVGYMDIIGAADTSGVEPMISAALGGASPPRGDVPVPTMPRDDALANAPDAGEGFFRVPPVIE
ncbi:MAG: Asp-tRNA(Asn)/Glu-tRNA(Gln) amidotransferase subunit GatC [Planctomycetota bacterium]|nr:Asp-tRNA(Asn)/Glu-tRNA(Gln) amidotransferase subunit GatC [Planctomycetota bacterium]